MRRSTVKAAASVAAIVASVATAFACAPDYPVNAATGAPVSTTARPVAPVIGGPVTYCQYDVYHGWLTVGKIGEENAGRWVSVLLRNNNDTRALAMHERMYADHGDAIARFPVWRTYTQRNVVKAWVSGHRCEPT